MNLDSSLNRIEVWADWYDPKRPPTTTSLESAINQVEKGSAKIVSPTRIHIFQKQKSTKIKKNFKAIILERDNHTCYFCGKRGTTLEHLLPKSRGGKNTHSNCVCSCSKCNFKKGNMTLEEYNEKHPKIN
jgi:5-methylcytosine-specific restriction endonuclease McrA